MERKWRMKRGKNKHIDVNSGSLLLLFPLFGFRCSLLKLISARSSGEWYGLRFLNVKGSISYTSNT